MNHMVLKRGCRGVGAFASIRAKADGVYTLLDLDLDLDLVLAALELPLITFILTQARQTSRSESRQATLVASGEAQSEFFSNQNLT